MFFVNDRFFRGLRLILALNAGRLPIGEVVLDVIQNKFLPDLRDKLADTPDEGEKAEIQRLIDVWEDYGNRNSQNGREWSAQAVETVTSAGNKNGLSESQKEDVAGDVMAVFYERPNLKKKLEDHDPMEGPLELMGFFRNIVYKESLSAIRKMRGTKIDPETGKRVIRERDFPLDNEEINQRGAPDERFTKMQIREIKRDMIKQVTKKLPSKDAKLFFEMWIKMAEKEGPDNVSLRMDILPEWSKATGKNKSVMYKHRNKAFQLMVDYLREKEHPLPSKKFMRKHKLSHRIAAAFWLRKFAVWMLEPWRGL